MKRLHTLDPRERRLLTAHVIHADVAFVMAHPNVRLTPSQHARLDRLLRERARGVPIAYLVGMKEFYGRAFSVRPGVLVPRPETEHSIDAALALLSPDSSATVIDVGTGSGCIGITIALERPQVRVFATDRSRTAIAVARTNARHFAVAKRYSVIEGDLLVPLHRRRIRPTLIVANLPYATPREYHAVRTEPRIAIVGGADGMTLFKRFFTQLQRFGYRVPLILEIDPRRTRQTIRLIRTSDRHATISVLKDLAGRNRVLVVRPSDL